MAETLPCADKPVSPTGRPTQTPATWSDHA
jgi:hypothetical protein